MVLSPLMSTFDPMPLLRDAFPTYSGSPTPVHLAGDASNRVYHRLHLGGGGEWPESAVVMQIGGDPVGARTDVEVRLAPEPIEVVDYYAPPPV